MLHCFAFKYYSQYKVCTVNYGFMKDPNFTNSPTYLRHFFCFQFFRFITKIFKSNIVLFKEGKMWFLKLRFACIKRSQFYKFTFIRHFFCFLFFRFITKIFKSNIVLFKKGKMWFLKLRFACINMQVVCTNQSYMFKTL